MQAKTRIGRSALFMVAAFLLMPAVALAQHGYPVKPIRILVGFLPGGGADTVARLVAPELSSDLGVAVVVENRPGAAGTIATTAVARAPADGYTLLVISAAEPAQGALRNDLPYRLERDLAPVSLITAGAFMLVVHPSVPARTVSDVIKLARAQPGKLTYSSAGVGGTPHLAGELFGLLAKVDIVHVPYKGGSAAVVANASGEVALSFNSIPALLPLLAAGKLRPIAVTSATRSPSLPDVPTISESALPEYDLSGWYGMLAPAGVPAEIVDRLSKSVARGVKVPRVNEVFSKQGLTPIAGTPDQFAAFLRKEVARAAMLIKRTGAQAK